MKQERTERDDYYCDIFRSPPRKNLIIATILTLIFHFILFVINFPASSKIFRPDGTNSTLTVLRPLPPPPQGLIATGASESKQEKKPAKKEKPQKIFVPIPDPTLDIPEPLIEKPKDPSFDISPKIDTDLDLGEINAPDKGKGESDGSSVGAGDPVGSGSDPGGSGQYKSGDPGVTSPILIKQIEPVYSEEARLKKIKGTMYLEITVLPDGSVSDIKIVNGLGYGLDEKAVEAISQWKFRPGTKNSKPVSVLVTIEIIFNLI